MVKATYDKAQIAKVKAAIRDLSRKQVRVGWFDTAKYDNGTPVAYVATIQEFGYPEGGIPARPFMRPTVANKTNEWKKTLAKGAKMVANGKLTYTQMLSGFGQSVAGQIAETISQITTPKLADATIAARARKRKSPGVSTKPLVDSGLMIQSVSHKVEDV